MSHSGSWCNDFCKLGMQLFFFIFKSSTTKVSCPLLHAFILHELFLCSVLSFQVMDYLLLCLAFCASRSLCPFMRNFGFLKLAFSYQLLPDLLTNHLLIMMTNSAQLMIYSWMHIWEGCSIHLVCWSVCHALILKLLLTINRLWY